MHDLNDRDAFVMRTFLHKAHIRLQSIGIQECQLVGNKLRSSLVHIWMFPDMEELKHYRLSICTSCTHNCLFCPCIEWMMLHSSALLFTKHIPCVKFTWKLLRLKFLRDNASTYYQTWKFYFEFVPFYLFPFVFEVKDVC